MKTISRLIVLTACMLFPLTGSADELNYNMVSLHSSAEKFIQEVFWRGYFKGWPEHRPQLWTDYQYQLTGMLTDYQDHAGYQRAAAGNTGWHVHHG